MRVRDHSRIEFGFARVCANDGNQSRNQKQHENVKQNAESALHGLSDESRSRQRHGEHARALRAIGRNADLPGAGGHDPERSGEELSVLRGTDELVGNRREFCRLTGNGDRHNVDFAHARGL